MSNLPVDQREVPECCREAATPELKKLKQENGFIRAMARELLVHNDQVNDIKSAVLLASEFVSKINWDDMHTHCRTDHDPANME